MNKPYQFQTGYILIRLTYTHSLTTTFIASLCQIHNTGRHFSYT